MSQVWVWGRHLVDTKDYACKFATLPSFNGTWPSQHRVLTLLQSAAVKLDNSRQQLSPLTEGSVLCRSTSLRLNYLIDQTGAPQGAALSLSNCAVACSIFRFSEKSSSTFFRCPPRRQYRDSLSTLDSSTRRVGKCVDQNQSFMQYSKRNLSFCLITKRKETFWKMIPLRRVNNLEVTTKLKQNYWDLMINKTLGWPSFTSCTDIKSH